MTAAQAIARTPAAELQALERTLALHQDILQLALAHDRRSCLQARIAIAEALTCDHIRHAISHLRAADFVNTLVSRRTRP